MHRGSLAALAYARALSDDVTAVYVSIDPVEAEKVRSKWETWGGGVQAGRPGFALPVAGRAIAGVHLTDHRRPPTERNDLHHRAPVRAEALVGQRAAHADRAHVANGADVQTRHRDHGGAVSGGVTRVLGPDCRLA